MQFYQSEGAKMATKITEPIIIYDEDYDGDYVLTATRRLKNPSSVLTNIVVAGLIFLVLLLGVAIFPRLLRKLFT